MPRPSRWSTTWSSYRNPMIFVQMQEALRLIEEDSVPHQRLALLLLDNACEVIMQRMCEQELGLNHLHGEAVELLRDRTDLSNADQQLFAQAQQQYVSNSQRRKLRDFVGMTEFLAKRGLIEEGMRAVLTRMHEYRNETYHRDQLRAGSLRPCVLIYMDLACDLLSRHTPIVVIRGEISSRTVAGQLRERLGLDPATVRTALTAHLLDRLHGTDDTLAWIRDDFYGRGNTAAVLAMAYLLAHEQYRHEVQEAEQTGKKPKQAPPQPYTPRDMDTWREQARGIEALTDRDEMFAAFANLEAQIDLFEEQVDQLGWIVSRLVE